MRATAVIGANFGDEGKGLMTDYFSTNETLVVRYNGGAQAGHTVVTPEKKRHVFSHFGSGSFAGATTFLSKYFICNPMLWKKELKTLSDLGVNPKLMFDPEAYLTLPYDMLINQEAERAKGDKRHGSCGYGINETVRRCLLVPISSNTCIGPIATNRSSKKIRYEHIRDTICKTRIEELGLKPNKDFLELFNSDVLLERFLDVLEEFLSTNEAMQPSEAITESGCSNVVFEGAQGLLLDEEHEFFPHVTRSKTGLKNVLDLCKEMNISNIDAVYVTRAYMTRHGRGPFPTETPGLSYVDKTNVSNEFQESLRFGILDVDLLSMSIDNDMQEEQKTNISVNPQLAITHVDQVAPDVEIKHQNQVIKVNGYDDLLHIVAEACKVNRIFVSTGTDRSRITSMLVSKSKIVV